MNDRNDHDFTPGELVQIKMAAFCEGKVVEFWHEVKLVHETSKCYVVKFFNSETTEIIPKGQSRLRPFQS